MYEAYSEVKISDKSIPKLKKMLKEKWKAENITFRQSARSWRIYFTTNDNRKVFAFEKVIENYGRIVLYKWINKIRNG